MENIKLHQYFKLSENEMLYYKNVFQFAKKSDILGKYKAVKLTKFSYNNVAEIKSLAKEADFIKVFIIVFGIPEKELMRIRVKEFFMALNWLRQELDQLIEREKHLVGDEDPKMLEAGSERLNVFKEMNTLIPLGKEYSKKPEEIAEWKYSTVFTLMYHEKVSKDIERNYTRLTTTT